MKRLIKTYYDVYNRDAAIICIDGEVIENKTHALAISSYLNSRGIETLYNNRCRPALFDDYKNLTKKDIRDVELVKNNIKSLAYAHRVDKENGIFIDTSKLYNISLNTVINLLKEKYSGYKIFDDNSYNYETLKFKQLANKTAEIYDSGKYLDIYFEVFKNPTAKVIEAVEKLHKGIRGSIDGNNIYIWNAYIAVHDNINEKITNKGVPINCLHFWKEENGYFTFDCYYSNIKISPDKLREIIKSNFSSLQQMGLNESTKIWVANMDVIHSDEKPNYSGTLERFLNLIPVKINRLIKNKKANKEDEFLFGVNMNPISIFYPGFYSNEVEDEKTKDDENE